ncbi:hypothetical protein [Nocardia niwae]|uniref:RHIM domain-containing protein n=1 Tax=Nocardia niwae TaxID=626084 RepID=A0ABV2XL69_9NOCA|nr:hypothetical protein [Nocardia niwae]
MDPVTLIAAAVAAGAAAGAGDTAKQAVRDAYTALKRLITRRYGVLEAEIVGVESEPEEPLRRQLLARRLSKTGAGDDEQVQSAAQELLRVVAEEDPAAAEAVGVKLTRVEAGGEIEINDLTGSAERAVDFTDVKAGGSIRISGVRAGRVDDQDDPSAAQR